MSICNTNQKFKGVLSISEDLVLNILESNLKMFLDWSFLSIGGWFDAKRNQYKVYDTVNNAQSKMLLLEDPAYETGQVWQGIRKDWVWESGVVYNSGLPLAISGIYVDDIFESYPSANYSIDYPSGRIIFSEPINSNKTVEVEHSYRYIQVYRGTDSPWTQILQYSSMNNSSKDIVKKDSGSWSIGPHHRIQMPCIVIEPISRGRSRPHELGNNNLIIEQDIEFYVFAETKNERNKILDILRLQQDSVIWLFDTNSLAQDEKYPLNYMGDLIDNPLSYPAIIEQYKWRKCWLKAVNLYEMESVHPDLFQGAVRITCEIISE